MSELDESMPLDELKTAPKTKGQGMYYQRISRSMVHSSVMRDTRLSDLSKLLVYQLLMWDKYGRIGCFVLHLPSLANSLGSSPRRVHLAVEELDRETDFLWYDVTNKYIVIRSFFEWNMPTIPRLIRRAVLSIQEIPKEFAVAGLFVDACAPLEAKMPAPMREAVKKLRAERKEFMASSGIGKSPGEG